MLLPDSLSLAEKDALSRGFDHGNYGNAYESQDWDSWSADLDEVADDGGYDRATGVRTCDAPGCYEAAVVAPDGNADYCEACGYEIASRPLRTFVRSFFAIEVV